MLELEGADIQRGGARGVDVDDIGQQGEEGGAEVVFGLHAEQGDVFQGDAVERQQAGVVGGAGQAWCGS